MTNTINTTTNGSLIGEPTDNDLDIEDDEATLDIEDDFDDDDEDAPYELRDDISAYAASIDHEGMTLEALEVAVVKQFGARITSAAADGQETDYLGVPRVSRDGRYGEYIADDWSRRFEHEMRFSDRLLAESWDALLGSGHFQVVDDDEYVTTDSDFAAAIAALGENECWIFGASYGGGAAESLLNGLTFKAGAAS